MKRRLPIPLAVSVGLLLACSPVVRIEAHFELPREAGKLDPKRLHVRGRLSCESFDLSAPPPAHPAPPEPGLEEEDDLVADDTDAGADAGLGAGGASADATVDASADADAASEAGVDAAAPGPVASRRGHRSDTRTVRFTMKGATAHAQFRASACWLAMTAFYDTNGNGKVDPGDYVAKAPAVDVHDRGLCAGNLNVIGPLKLSAVR